MSENDSTSLYYHQSVMLNSYIIKLGSSECCASQLLEIAVKRTFPRVIVEQYPILSINHDLASIPRPHSDFIS